MFKLLDGIETLGIKLTDDQVDSFATYYRELADWNQRINLTAITDFEDVQIKHFVDSLSVIKSEFVGRKLRPWCPQAFMGNSTGLSQSSMVTVGEKPMPPSLLDIGTGAGFPGIPLKILCPDIKLTLLESIGKKANFLGHMVSVLNLQDVTILSGRAEDFGREPKFREKFDIVTARAVAILATLAEYGLPFCRIGGVFVAMKKANIDPEIESAQKAVRILGGRIAEQIDIKLRGVEEDRMLVVIEKVAPTPAAFPRKPNLPSKHPL